MLGGGKSELWKTMNLYHSVSPLVGSGNPPPPLQQASVCTIHPPLPKRDVTHSPTGEGGGVSPNSDDWRKSLALCILCAVNRPPPIMGGTNKTRKLLYETV